MIYGYDLIEELINNSNSFHKKGLGNELLKAYFEGLPINTIKPLLKNQDELVIKEILYVLSELSSTECNLFLDDIILLLDYKDFTIKYYAMQCVFSGTHDSQFEKFAQIIMQTNTNDSSVINYVFELISYANNNQLSNSLKELKKIDSIDSISHEKGLSLFINNKIINKKVIIEFLKSDDIILNGYGVLFALKKDDEKINIHQFANNDFIYDELLSALNL